MKSLLARALRARADPPGRRASRSPRPRPASSKARSSTRAAPPFPAPPSPSATRPPTSSAPSETDADGRFRGLLLPLGPYRVAVTMAGFGTHVREGLDLQVGQTINLPVTLKVSARAGGGGGHRRGAGHRDHARGRRPTASTRAAIQGLPNNGRNFLDFTLLTPGRLHRPGPRRRRADRERPEGDPEQRLRGRRRLQQPVLRRAARRPAPGLHLQHGRRQGGRGGGRGGQRRVRPLQRRLRQRGHQVRHQRHPRHRPPVLQERRALLGAQARGRHLGRQVRLQPVPDRLHARRAAEEGQGLLLPRPRLPGRHSTKQTDPSRIEPRVVDFFSNLGSPNENGADRAHQRRPGVPGQGRLAAERRSTWPRSATTTPGRSR